MHHKTLTLYKYRFLGNKNPNVLRTCQYDQTYWNEQTSCPHRSHVDTQINPIHSIQYQDATDTVQCTQIRDTPATRIPKCTKYNKRRLQDKPGIRPHTRANTVVWGAEIIIVQIQENHRIMNYSETHTSVKVSFHI